MKTDQTEDLRTILNLGLIVITGMIFFAGPILVALAVVAYPVVVVTLILCYVFRYSGSDDPEATTTGKTGGNLISDDDPDIRAHLKRKAAREADLQNGA